MSDFIFFRVGKQIYATDILKVKSIEPFISPIPLPQTPSYILGIFNLRGIVYTLIDLRDRFALGKTKLNNSKRLKIITLRRKDVKLAILVDEVLEVIRIDNTSIIEQLPDFYRQEDNSKFLRGIIRLTKDNKLEKKVFSSQVLLDEVLKNANIYNFVIIVDLDLIL